MTFSFLYTIKHWFNLFMVVQSSCMAHCPFSFQCKIFRELSIFSSLSSRSDIISSTWPNFLMTLSSQLFVWFSGFFTEFYFISFQFPPQIFSLLKSISYLKLFNYFSSTHCSFLWSFFRQLFISSLIFLNILVITVLQSYFTVY